MSFELKKTLTTNLNTVNLQVGKLMPNDKKTTWLILLLLVVFSLPLWLVKYPPLTDYPNHLLRIHIIKEYENPLFNFQDYFLVKWKLLPNLASDVIILFLSYLFPIQISGKIFLNIFILLFPLSIFYFLKAIDRQKIWLGFFSFLLVYNWYFNMGYINFYGSIPVFFFALGYWLKSDGLPTWKDKLIFMSLTLLLFFFHLFSYFALGFSCLIVLLGEKMNFTKLKNSLIAFIPSLALGFNYLFLQGAGSSVHRGVLFLPLWETVKYLLIYTFINFSKKDILIFVVPFLILAYLFFKSVFSKTANKKEKSLLLLFGSLCGLFFVLPYMAAAVWPFNIRLNLFIIFIGIASITSLSVDKLKKFVLPWVVTFSLIGLAHTWFSYSQLSRQIEIYTSGIKYVGQNKNILPLTIDMSGGCETIAPFRFCWAYYHIAQGGVGPYLFHLPHGQVVNYRKNAGKVLPAPSLYPFKIEEFNINEHTADYDCILWWGSYPETEAKLKEKFKLTYQKGRLKIYEKTKVFDGEKSHFKR